MASKVGSVLWSTAIGIGIVALGATILMPSTKSGRAIHYHKEEETPTTVPTTQATTEPTGPAQRTAVMPGSKSGAVFRP
ncbi:MAG TPA: hypothetical protein VGP94_00900 [Tepidisphaeraceae bacterium]|jgi:hypothetical protein|nr:hypothetical protein [Tepidisphaeraceae bacterium]